MGFVDGLTGAITRAVSVVAPGYALKRDYAYNAFISLRGYDAAKPNRFTRGKKITDGNINQELLAKGDIAKIRKLTRDICKNSPFARAVQRALVATIIGAEFTIQAKATDKDGKLLEDVNKVVNRYWKIWVKECDVRGKKSFVQFLQQAVSQYCQTGEYVLQKIYRPSNYCGLRLASIDSDLLDHTKNDGNVIGGIEFDKDLIPKVYNFKGSDSSLQTNSTIYPVPANQIIHSYIEERPGQSRGEPWFAPCLEMLWSAHRAMQSELHALEIQAMLAVIYQSGNGGTSQPFSGSQASTGVVDGSGNVTQKLASGSIMGITNAENLSIVDPKRPGNMFAPFIETVLTHVYSCVGSSYAKGSKDYSKGNFSSQRMGEQDVRRQSKVVQNLIVDQIVNDVYEFFYRELVVNGIISVNVNDFEDNKHFYLQKEVAFQPYEYIQPLQDAEADKAKLASKLYTFEEMLEGRPVEEHFQQLAKEKSLADKYNIILYQEEAKVVNVGGALTDDLSEAQKLEQ